MTKLAFVDTETTGLDRQKHEVWEIAIIVRDFTTFKDDEHEFELEAIQLENADPTALRINGYYDRRDDPNWEYITEKSVAKQVAKLLAGAHFVAAVPDFDAFFIEKFLRRYGEAPAWHYHLVCVENIAAGFLGMEPPWNSRELGEKLGVVQASDTLHTALGDARWVRDLYDAVMKNNKHSQRLQGNYCTFCGASPGELHNFDNKHPAYPESGFSQHPDYNRAGFNYVQPT